MAILFRNISQHILVEQLKSHIQVLSIWIRKKTRLNINDSEIAAMTFSKKSNTQGTNLSVSNE